MINFLTKAKFIVNENEEDKREREIEQSRAVDFSTKFEKINKIPFFKNTIKWMYREGWSNSSALIVITIIGFIFRIWKVSESNLWIDEVLSAEAITTIVQNGMPTLPSGVNYFRDILYHYLCALSSLLFGVSNFSMRLPSVIFGTLTVPLSYYLGKQIKNKKVAIAAALLVALNSMEIAFSREVRYYQMFQFFYGLSLLLFTKYACTTPANSRLLTYGLIALCFSFLTTFSSVLLIHALLHEI